MILFFRHLFLVLLLLLSICVEHVIGLPFLSLTFALFLFAVMPMYWKSILFLTGGMTLATVYFIPFWVSFVIFFCLRIPIDFFSLNRRYEDLAMIATVPGCVALMAIVTHYTFSWPNIVLILLQSLLFCLVMVYFVRQRHPHQRLRAQYAK